MKIIILSDNISPFELQIHGGERQLGALAKTGLGSACTLRVSLNKISSSESDFSLING